MKKNRTKKTKLAVTKQRLRTLDADALRQANGGAGTGTVKGNDATRTRATMEF